MHLFHIPQCNIQNCNVHLSVLNGELWDMEQMHCGICEICLLDPKEKKLQKNLNKKTPTYHIQENQSKHVIYKLTAILSLPHCFNTLRQRQNGRHFADDIFKRIFFNENVWISIKTSLMFVPDSPINKIPALFQIMAWCRPGDKPLSEAMLVSLLAHKCVTRPQRVN